eukprot:5350884-Prymnesium_polylepis.1
MARTYQVGSEVSTGTVYKLSRKPIQLCLPWFLLHLDVLPCVSRCPNHPRAQFWVTSDFWPPTCQIRQLWGSDEITGDIFILSGYQTRRIRVASMELLT